MLEDYINKLKKKVKELFSSDTTGHNLDHLERTMNLALSIQESEGGDRIVIGIAAFLHDIHRIMQSESGKYVSPRDSLHKVKELLSVIDLDQEHIDKILYAIEKHEDYNWNNPENKESDINTLILQDADNLEAIGAIGIVRSFIYSVSINQPFYDPKVPLEEKNEFVEGQKEVSTIHHFYHKQFYLADNMNTKKGRELAIQRTYFTRKFAEEFIEEWNGNR